MAAINSNLKHTKIISRLCEKCVITAKVDVVVLRAVGEPTAFWCWFLSSKCKENEINASILGGTSETNVGRKIQTSEELFVANLGLRFCHVKVAWDCLCLFLRR